MVVRLNTFIRLSLCLMLGYCAGSVCGQTASHNELLKGCLDGNLSVDAAFDCQIKYNMRKSEDLDDEGCFSNLSSATAGLLQH
ncbi:hypothetical protein PHYPO_G00099140 [Pangasianodon hypophthalmus]|uniref:Secreted protein n=1 Tax=Pangasianodon hypophthalmus TaxID=310915 RepID=A0A5N5LBN9_PANHP|nr:hypothetical protein PHYPO_G00099140 [Pangasianodon hypophthalmus]